MDQIAKIFTGEITNWSEVGGADGEIACIGREANSGTRDGFESITGTEDTCKLSQELTSTGAVIEAVKNSPNAIGYASLSAVEGKEGRRFWTGPMRFSVPSCWSPSRMRPCPRLHRPSLTTPPPRTPVS